jgi:hypothetical protein
MEEQKDEQKGYLRQIGLQSNLKGQIADTVDKVKEQLSFGSVLIQTPQEMEVLKTLDYSPQSFLTLEGLTVKSFPEDDDDDLDSENDWNGEQGVEVYGNDGELIKYSIGASMITDGTTPYFFKTPMIYGDLSEKSWEIDLDEELKCAEYYIQECEIEEIEDPRATINLYYKWVESLKPQLFKILNELGITEINMDLPSENDINNL